MGLAAAGTRGELVAGGANGFELAFKADALWVGTAIEGWTARRDAATRGRDHGDRAGLPAGVRPRPAWSEKKVWPSSRLWPRSGARPCTSAAARPAGWTSDCSARPQ